MEATDVEATRGTALVIAPIPRYEPDPVSVTGMTPRPATVAPSRPHAPDGPRPGRAIADRVDPSARAFAVSALTMLLEIIDRRRPVAQLASVAAPHIVDQVSVWSARPQPASAAPPRARPPAATLMRVHLQWSGPDAAEVSATYSRGVRVKAMAARVQRVPVRVRPGVPGGPRTTELRWMLVNVTTA
ncbi:Rv3235 family protein [Williamsia phyllosphaerae]|uniref:Uncharacterized protein n=1 Tax=Williamsia phyllosphaerae TaxID=885042 RepID=A0ABQ1URF6_9NOCA|nr:Rv3235 family protein [Williamsia phyllosphaerae]GGF25332.1 hypothetical protein GCM10007298_21510 [Williamsia phyllosphaerae]